jgi:hypothetical protein
MLRQYPPSEDVYIKGVHSLGQRELVGQWRDSILNHLRDRGTASACSAIERVSITCPELKWVKAQLLAERAVYRQRSWRPPSPAEILKIAEERQKQVSDGDNRTMADRGGIAYGDHASNNIAITGPVGRDVVVNNTYVYEAPPLPGPALDQKTKMEGK